MAPIRLQGDGTSAELIEDIERLSGQNLYACYQCGKCSAGCPLAFAMEVLPHQLVRRLHFEQVQEVLASNTFWLCAACLTCAARCPKGVDLARIMEALRAVVLRAGKGPLQAMPASAQHLAEVPQMAAVGAFRKLTG